MYIGSTSIEILWTLIWSELPRPVLINVDVEDRLVRDEGRDLVQNIEGRVGERLLLDGPSPNWHTLKPVGGVVGH